MVFPPLGTTTESEFGGQWGVDLIKTGLGFQNAYHMLESSVSWADRMMSPPEASKAPFQLAAADHSYLYTLSDMYIFPFI